MKTIIKSLLVWILLLAVPFQGFASATMFVCAPISSVPAVSAQPPAPMAHAAVRADLSEHCKMMAERQGESKSGKAGHEASAKCSSCSACHAGAALASAYFGRVPLETAQFHPIAFDPAFLPVAHRDLPERPPQARLA